MPWDRNRSVTGRQRQDTQHPPHRQWWVAFGLLLVLMVYVLAEPFSGPVTGRRLTLAILAAVVAADVMVIGIGLRRWYADAVTDARRLRERLSSLTNEHQELDRKYMRVGEALAELQVRERDLANGERAQTEACRHAAAFLARQQLPAIFEGKPAPPAPPDEYLDPLVAGYLSEARAAVNNGVERFWDEADATRAVVVRLAQRLQTTALRVQDEATEMADRHPQNEDVLAASYTVQHAAAVAARHAQNVRLLAGDTPGQQWPKPISLYDVVRAAAGRITDYRRVQTYGGQDIGVVPRAAEAAIHLVSELLDNAAQSSPTSTDVRVQVLDLEQRAAIEIHDCGGGLDPYRLENANDLASGHRPMELKDLGELAPTGLAVVGHYARLFGFRVMLRESPYGGLQAVVGIPAELVQTLDSAPPAHRITDAASGRPLALAGADRAALGPDDSRPEGLPRRRSRRRDGAATPPAAVQAPPSGAPQLRTPEEEREWMSRYASGAGIGPQQARTAGTGDERSTEGQ